MRPDLAGHEHVNAYARRCQHDAASDLRAHAEIVCEDMAEAYENNEMRSDLAGNENMNAYA